MSMFSNTNTDSNIRTGVHSQIVIDADMHIFPSLVYIVIKPCRSHAQKSGLIQKHAVVAVSTGPLGGLCTDYKTFIDTPLNVCE